MIFTPERGEISIGKRSARLGGRERKSSARLFYLTRAVDGHYFIGITVDISSRFREVEAGRGVVRGGCRCTLRCAVSITHPSAVSTSPNRRFCRRAPHFSYSNLIRPLSQPLPLLSISVSRILHVFLCLCFRSQGQIFLHATLSHTPFLIITLFREEANDCGQQPV